MNTQEQSFVPKNWAAWPYKDEMGLARYVCDDAEESFPLAGEIPYEAGDTEDGRRTLVSKIYEILASLPEEDRIWYDLNKYFPDQEAQLIRGPRQIRASKQGTCLDLALLFSGLCLARRLCPVVVLTRKHAFALVALDRGLEQDTLNDKERPLGAGPVKEIALIQNLVQSGSYVAVECTGFASVRESADGPVRPPLPFDQAKADANKILGEGDLLFALDVASARYQHGVPGQMDREGEPSWETLRRRWSTWAEIRCNRIQLHQDLHLGEAERSTRYADLYAERLVTDRPWHERVKGWLDDVVQIRSGITGIQHLQRELARVDLDDSYPAIVRKLATAVSGKNAGIGPNALEARIRELETQTGLSRGEIQGELSDDPEIRELGELTWMQKALRHLTEEAKNPHYERCLLVVGDAGAGKTHLSASVGFSGKYRPILPLWLEREDPGAGIREKIESALRRITGYEWTSLEDFQGSLARLEEDPVLIVVLDEYENWSSEAVEKLICDTLRGRSLYWMLLVQHAAFSRVAPGSKVWSRLAWHPQLRKPVRPGERSDPPTIGSWIDLDALDLSDHLGAAIIREVSSVEGSPVEIPEGSPAERDASNPLIAWTFLGCRPGLQVGDLVNLAFIDFVDRFWDLRESRMATSLPPGTLKQLTCAAAYVMARDRELGLEPPRENLILRIADLVKARPVKCPLEDRELTRQAVQELEDAGFWKEVKKPDPVIGEAAFLHLRNPFFWCYRIAQSLEPGLLAQEEWSFDTILPAGTEAQLREGVIEFLLLLADRKAGTDDLEQERVTRLWQQALEAPAARSAAWLAAAKARLETQQAVAERAPELRPSIEDPQALFAFLYFLGEARPEALPAAGRVAVLQPLFGAIRDAGYVDYFLHVFERNLATVTSGQELLSVIHELTGAEALRATERVSDLLAMTAARLHGKDFRKTLRWLLSYAREESKRPLEKVAPRVFQEERVDGKYFLREWIFFSTLGLVAYLAECEGVHAAPLFRELMTLSWYDPARLHVSRRVGHDMEVQADTVLGFRYRWSRGEAREEYQALVEELSQSLEARDRCLAFFLVRHTQPAAGRKGVPVSPLFKPIFERLFLDRDPEVCSTVDWFYDDFKENLGSGFPGLEKEREAFHAVSTH